MRGALATFAAGRCRPRDSGCGFAVLMVVFAVVIFAMLGTAAVALVAGSSQGMGDEYHAAQAFDVAQAGLERIALELKDDTDWSDNASVTRSFGPGSFTVTFPAQTASSATVRSVGTVQGISAALTEDLARGSAAAFDAALYTEGNISASGQGLVTVGGDAVTGGQASASGQGHLDIDGDLDTRLGTSTSGLGVIDVTGDTTTGYTTADVPDPDWSYWQSGATIHSGNWSFSGMGSYTYSGVHYVSGNFSMSGQANVMINGTLVVAGTVSQSGQSVLNIHPTSPNPAIIAGGNVTLSGQGSTAVSYGGYLYSGGTLTLSGQGDMAVSGGLIGMTGVTLSGQGAVTVMHEGGTPLGFIGGEGSGIEVSDWEETE